jgi:parvulin-like peptidyl-prolyl isomerase
MTLIVDGEKIEDSQVHQEIERLRPQYEQAFGDMDPKQRESQLRDWSRENIIEQALLKQHAKKHGPKIPKAEVDAAFEQVQNNFADNERFKAEFEATEQEQVREQIELQMRIERILGEFGQKLPKPSKDAVLKFYEQNKKQFETPERIRVAHIVKHVDGRTDDAAALDTITKARDELNSGGLFETLAAKYSDCPDNGGDLGYITAGQMVEEFEDVVFNLAVGQVSDIFRTRFGFHIARLYDRKPAAIPSLDEVKQHVVDQITKQMRDQAVDDFVDALKSKATIEEI